MTTAPSTVRLDRGIIRDAYAAIDLMYLRGLSPAEAAARCTYSVPTLSARLSKRRKWSTESWERWRGRVVCNWLLEATRLTHQADRDRILEFCWEQQDAKGIGMDFVRAVAQDANRHGYRVRDLSFDQLEAARLNVADPLRELRG